MAERCPSSAAARALRPVQGRQPVSTNNMHVTLTLSWLMCSVSQYMYRMLLVLILTYCMRCIMCFYMHREIQDEPLNLAKAHYYI